MKPTARSGHDRVHAGCLADYQLKQPRPNQGEVAGQGQVPIIVGYRQSSDQAPQWPKPRRLICDDRTVSEVGKQSPYGPRDHDDPAAEGTHSRDGQLEEGAVAKSEEGLGGPQPGTLSAGQDDPGHSSSLPWPSMTTLTQSPARIPSLSSGIIRSEFAPTVIRMDRIPHLAAAPANAAISS